MVVRTHASIVRAAFACDLIRVATLSCLPAEHDEALTITDPSFFTGSPPESGSANYEAYEAIANAHVAVNETMAAIVNEFRTQVDPLDANPSANLLDRTIIPFVTEVAHCGHEPDPMPALLFGGYNLGIRGGRFENFEASPRPHNDLWVTLAQALFRTTDPLAVLADEDFAKDGVTPIAGLYTPPP